jgi:hypothetical protein
VKEGVPSADDLTTFKGLMESGVIGGLLRSRTRAPAGTPLGGRDRFGPDGRPDAGLRPPG